MPRLRTLAVLLSGILGATAVSGADNPVVGIEGGDEAVQANVRAHLGITAEDCSASMSRLRRLSPRVSSNVDNALRALGYYSARHSHAFSEVEGCWQLTIRLEPGNPVRVGSVDIQVLGDESARSLFAPLIEELRPQEGVPLNQGQYESLKSRMSSLAVENGYFSSRFTESEVVVLRSENRADIHLVFDTGERYRFGEFRITNNTRLRDELIQRMIPLEQGDEYASSSLFELRDRLNESQFFSAINLYPDLRDIRDREVPIEIELEPRPRHVYTAGLGFTTDTGPRVRISYDNRYVNRRGHSLESDASLSPLRHQLDVAYSIPLRDPAHEKLQLRAGVLGEETDTYESDLYTIRANHLKELDNGWLRDIFINHQMEKYVVGERADSRLTILGLSFSRSRSDNPVFTTRGWSVFTELKGASEDILSDTSFAQLTTTGRRIISLDRMRLMTRLELGTTWISDEQTLPVSLRYFAGGDRSVRGYKYQTLGPEDESGEVIGGKHMALASLEVDYPIADNWRVATFYDVGNAFSDFNDVEWKHTVGIGIRWLSPIGPIRFDLGHPLKDGGVRIHVTMGPDL